MFSFLCYSYVKISYNSNSSTAVDVLQNTTYSIQLSQNQLFFIDNPFGWNASIVMSGIKTNYTLKPSRYPGLFTAKQNISILIKPHFNQQLELKSRILPNYCKGFGLASTYLDLNTLRSQLKGNQCVWLPYIENVQHSNEKYLYTYSIRSISTFLPQNQSVLMLSLIHI